MFLSFITEGSFYLRPGQTDSARFLPLWRSVTNDLYVDEIFISHRQRQISDGRVNRQRVGAEIRWLFSETDRKELFRMNFHLFDFNTSLLFFVRRAFRARPPSQFFNKSVAGWSGNATATATVHLIKHKADAAGRHVHYVQIATVRRPRGCSLVHPLH
jgi:hypothetical protein